MKKNRIFLLIVMGIVLLSSCNKDSDLPVDPDNGGNPQNPAANPSFNQQVRSAVEVQEIIQEFRETGRDLPIGIAEGIGLSTERNSTPLRRAAASGLRPEQVRRLAASANNRMGSNGLSFRFDADSIPPDHPGDTIIDNPGDTIIDNPGDTVIIDNPGDTVIIDHPGDTIIYDEDTVWIDDPICEYDSTCYHEEYWVNDDGSFTYVIDYGDGCDIWGEFLKGKIIETYYYHEAGFKSSIEYVNFGSYDWQINGTATYEGSHTDLGDSTSTRPADQYTASWNWTEDLDFLWIEDGSASSASVSGQGEAFADATQYSILSYSQNVTSQFDGEVSSFEIKSLSELVSLFSCYDSDAYIWVSGQEQVNIGQDEFVIDYGNGECDNIITIIAGDEVIDIDLDEEWEDDFDDEDEDDEDNEDDEDEDGEDDEG